ncbi:MAG: D-alanyl-D-alanine carboxypeptidase/D-alanyl-D-alanine-endopeptidase [Sulfurovum sp.]
MRYITFYLLFSIFLSISLFALPQAIEKEIRNAGLSKKDVSIYIKEVGKNGKTIASLNRNTMRIPASVIKVLTTYASVLKLGFNYRWKTRFYTKGVVKNGILNGDLVVKGFGDPTLGDRDLKKIVTRIKRYKIKHIKGNIIIDRTYFNVSTKNNSGFDKNLYSAYNAMPDAMMFNERISKVYLNPRTGKIRKKHGDNSYDVINRLKMVNRSCRGKYSWVGVKIENRKKPTMILQGSLSKKCKTQVISKVITKPYKSFYYALKNALKKSGVKVDGTLKVRKTPKGSKPLFIHYSQTLEKIISKTAKKSNNLYARHILLLLGSKIYGSPATIEKGRKAVNYILQINGALNNKLPKIDNGCGLSRKSKLSAKMMAIMLDDAYSRHGKRWMNTLSIAGVDGTIKRRFRGSVVQNRAWMKTGTVNRVKNISGYVKDKSGKLYIVVILVNSKKSRYGGARLQNRVIKWLVNGRKVVHKVVKKQKIKKAKVNKPRVKIIRPHRHIVKKPRRQPTIRELF